MTCELMRQKSVHNQSGAALVEAVIAAAMIGLFLFGLMMASSNLLGLLRNAKESMSVSQSLQERVEQMRIANWLQITDANYLKDSLLATATASTIGLSKPVETVTVSAYPANAAVPVAKVARSNGSVQIISSSTALSSERMVRVDVSLTWESFPRKRQRTRTTTALIANGGISK